MRSQLKELAHAADRALDPELRRRLEAKAHRLQQQYDQAADHGTPRLTS
ncbi:small hydrophilic protein [Streptomyces sp. SID1034]|nr:small hydrophilic protein [Streptomyces sp. SID1034]